MDIGTLARSLTTFLVPALPYLVKVGEGAAQEAGKKMFGEAWDSTKALWNRLRPKVENKPAALEAIQDLVKTPDDEDLMAVFRHQIKKLLIEDESLAKDVEQLLSKANAANDSQVHIKFRGVAFGDYASGNITNTGSVSGNIVLGDKHKIAKEDFRKGS